MKNKGFTLIELIAVVVIIGVLAIYSLPRILGLISSNTNKVYVNDAIKLVSLAEYKMKSNDSSISRPDDGDCIILSLVYLDNSSFDTPPGGGEYMKEASFVVVKNSGGKLEYSTMLVEKTKDSTYRGVELSSIETLSISGATRHVKDFKKSDLYYVEDNDSNKDSSNIVSTKFINSKLGGGYVSEIQGVYNYSDVTGAEVSDDFYAPSIERASITGDSSKQYNSTSANLEVSAKDNDTEQSKLQIRYNIVYDNSIATSSYPDVSSVCGNTGDLDSGCYLYGSDKTFKKSFDFSSRLSYTGETKSLKMYLVVSDDEGNYDRRVLTYSLHNNESPTINEFIINKAINSTYNLANTRIKLSVSDDMDATGDLMVCYTQNKSDKSCEGDNAKFEKYSSLFDSNGYMNYTFTCGDKACPPLGGEKNLYIYVKDSYGEVSEGKASYDLYKVTSPKITTLSLDSKHERFNDLYEYYGDSIKNDKSLSYQLVLLVSKNNDLTSNSNLRVTIEEMSSNSFKDKINGSSTNTSMTYADYLNGKNSFKFSGNYDGKDRYIKVTIMDQYGQEDTKTYTYSNVHKNMSPVIFDTKVVSTDSPCKNSNYCTEELGRGLNRRATIKFNVIDDLDDVNKLRLCIGNNCTPNSSYNSLNDKVYNIVSNYRSTTDDEDLMEEYETIDDSISTIDKKISENNTSIENKKNQINVDNNNISSLKKEIDEVAESLSTDPDNVELQESYKKLLTKSSSLETDIRNLNNEIDKLKNDISDLNAEKNNYKDKKSSIEGRDFFKNKTISVPVVDSKNVTIKAVDSYNSVGSAKNNEFNNNLSYNVYVNRAPTLFSMPAIENRDGLNIGRFNYIFSAQNDSLSDSTDSSMSYKVCYYLQDDKSKKETCTSDKYKSFKYTDSSNSITENTSEYIDLGLSIKTYKGQKYIVYARVKDGLGKESIIGSMNYVVYKDLAPSVSIFDNGFDVDNDDNSNNDYTDNKFSIVFIIDDIYDTDKICINDNEKVGSCTKFLNSYDGSNTDKHKYTFTLDRSYFSSNHQNSDDKVNLYLHVVDSNNQETVGESIIYYDSCSHRVTTNTEYSLNKGESPITTKSCGGACYLQKSEYKTNDKGDYLDSDGNVIDTSKDDYKDKLVITREGINESVIRKFTKTVTTTDNILTDKTCNKDVSDYKGDCSFYTCFQNTDGSYSTNVIGTKYNEYKVKTPLTIGDKTYECSGYYQGYKASIDRLTKELILTKVDSLKYCATSDKKLIDAYKYDSNSKAPYIRAIDPSN